MKLNIFFGSVARKSTGKSLFSNCKESIRKFTAVHSFVGEPSFPCPDVQPLIITVVLRFDGRQIAPPKYFKTIVGCVRLCKCRCNVENTVGLSYGS